MFNGTAKGQLSEPDHRGRRWLQCGEVMDECKIQLSALEARKYRKWYDTEIVRQTTDASRPMLDDPVSDFFRSLHLHRDDFRREYAGKSKGPYDFRRVPVQRAADAKNLQELRRRSFEEEIILNGAPHKLKVGQLGTPDSFGWRWYQCAEDVQILLPPDAGVQYSIFLMLEENELRRATCRNHVHKFNDARNRFNDLCMRSKLDHPVRGISSSPSRFALPYGFQCRHIDKIVGRQQDKAEYALLEDVGSMPSEVGALSQADQYWRRWLRMDNDTWVLLPADVASQYDFTCKFSRSKSLDRHMQKIIQELHYALVPVDGASSPAYAGTLYLLRHDTRSTSLDKAVARIELRLAELAGKHSRNVSPLPDWRNDIFESARSNSEVAGSLNRSPKYLHVDVLRKSSRGHRKTMSTQEARKSYWDKELPPLPLTASVVDLSQSDERRKYSLDRRNSVPDSPIERIRRTFARSILSATSN